MPQIRCKQQRLVFVIFALHVWNIINLCLCFCTEVAELAGLVYVGLTSCHDSQCIFRWNTRCIVTEGSETGPCQFWVPRCVSPDMCPNEIWRILCCHSTVRSMWWRHQSVITKYRSLLCVTLKVVCFGIVGWCMPWRASLLATGVLFQGSWWSCGELWLELMVG